MSTPIMKFFSENAYQIRLRDGRTIYCDSDNRWFLSGVKEYFDTLFLLLSRNDLLPVTPEGEKAVIDMFNNIGEASELSDGALIDECLSAFDLPFGSRQDALMQEVLMRFQKAICLDETPNGITADGEPVWADEIQ